MDVKMDKYIDGVEVPEFDSVVTEVIESNQFTLDPSGRMLIGFINNEYIAYRKISIDGPINFLDTINAFTSNGFIDELAKSTGPVKGFDVIFKYVGK
jgi:hypothetical protein